MYKRISDNQECCFVQKSETIKLDKQTIPSFFWAFNGKIMCRKTMNTATIIIKNEEDINQKLNR